MASDSPRGKIIVAHFMVGNTYPYTLEDWKDDIVLAVSKGLDGFALNLGPEPWQKESVSRCYAAALDIGGPFKLFLCFDMTSLRGSTPEDVYLLREYVAETARHPHQLRYDGKVLVSTFAGQDRFFGQSTLEDAWTYVKDVLEEVAPIYLVPSFFINPERYPGIAAMDGYFNVGGALSLLHSRYSVLDTDNSPRDQVECAKLDTDRHHIHHLGGRTFMAAVSPWFFTHYGPESWNKNWIYRGDDWLLVRRWEQLVAMRDKVDIVQVISWNDYGESHYIGPIKGAQPNSEAWVDGFPHEAWLELNSYFARAFKGGSYPSVVERDRIFTWSRPHLKAAEAAADAVPRPDMWQLTDDKFWVVVLATEPGEVRLSVGGDDDHPSATSTHMVRRGLSKLSHPMIASGGMKAQLLRGGVVVAECAPGLDEFRVQEKPKTYNFNVYVAVST